MKKVLGYILLGIGFVFINIIKFLLWISVCVMIGLTFILNLENGFWPAVLATVIGAVIVSISAWVLGWLATLLGGVFMLAGAKLVE